MAPAVRPQISMYDVQIEDAELEKALEDREKLKEFRKRAQATFKEQDDVVKGLINASSDFGAALGPVRVGRFLISKRKVKGRSVAFETEDSTRMQISLLVED